MEKDAVKLCCPNEYCQSANPLTEKFCLKCGTPLPKRYLWAVGDDPSLNNIGTVLGDRYLVVSQSILLDIKPGLLPQIPDIENSETIKPYLKLISYRLNTPQLYGILILATETTQKQILLIEKPPVISQIITDPETIKVSVCNSLHNVWAAASSIRQLHWLWQIAHLWQPLLTEGVASSLLDPRLLRVEGPLIRLLELRLDQKTPLNLAKLGEFWQKLVKTAKPSVSPFLQKITHSLIQNEISSSEQLIQVLDRGLIQLERNQTTNIKIYTKTDPGPSRQRNEDACYPPSQTLISKPPQQNTLAIVCDGIGGHEGGNVASNLAIETIEQKVKDLTSVPYENINPSLLLSDLEQAVASVNDKISQRNDNEHRQGRQRMGTTIVMALPIAHEMYITHVGDSRAYWINRHSCHQITLDDDVACREVRLGYALYREALQHSGSGSLVQALGMSKSTSLHPTSQRFIIDEDAVFLLTSDGLSDFDRVDEYWESEILPLLYGKTNIENIVNKLIEIANTKNGHDNVTIALVHYDVKYSEPEHIIEADISNLVPPQTLDLTAPTINGENITHNQSTELISNKVGKFRSLPLQLLIIPLLVLFSAGLAYWLKSKLQITSNQPSPLPTIATTAINTPPVIRNLENLSTGWIIQSKNLITLNQRDFEANTFFQVKSIEKKGNDAEVKLQICQSSTSPEATEKLELIISLPELKQQKKSDISVLPANAPNPCKENVN